MGNVAARAYERIGRCRPTGRLMRPDGSTEEFQEPLHVSKLVTHYPEYLVVHCASSAALRRGPAISVMDCSDFLLPGHIYILCPLPPQYTQTYDPVQPPTKLEKTIKEAESVLEKINYNYSASSPLPRKKSSSSSAQMNCLLSFLAQLRRARDAKADPEKGALVPLLRSNRKPMSSSRKLNNSGSFKNTRRARKVRPFAPSMWRPALDVIPESRSFGNERWESQ